MGKLRELVKPYRGLPKEVYVIFVARIVNALGCFVMPLLTIILREKIGLTEQMTGFFISMSGFLFMPASMLGGKLADVVGRKKVIVLFDLLAIILYTICGFMEPTMNMIYVLMLAGASMTAAGPAHDSLMADLTTPENREGAYSLSYMGWNIGFAAGPAIGGALYENHLRLVFIGDAFTALVALILITFFVRETIGDTKKEFKDETRVLEKREGGSIFAVLLRRPILIYFALVVLGFNFVYSQWSYMMPMHILEKYPLHKAEYYGRLASFNGIVVMLFTPLITRLMYKIKNIRRMVYGGILYALGFGMLGVLNTIPYFVASVFIFTLGEIVVTISTMPFIANHTPASHRGRMSAIIPMIFGLGYTLGPVGMGLVLKYLSIEGGWIVVGAVGIVFSALMYLLEVYDSKKNLEIKDTGEEDLIVS